MKDIKQLTVLSVKNVNCYKYAKDAQMNSNFSSSYGIARFINTESEQGSIDLKDRIVKQVSKMVKSDNNGKVLTNQELDAYLIGDALYTKANGKWTRSVVTDASKAMEERDQLKSLIDLLSKSDLKTVGTEMVDGQKCYKLKIMLEPYTAHSILAAQALAAQSASPEPLPKTSMDDLAESSELFNNSKISCTFWVTADKYLPMKMERQTRLTLTPECLKASSKGVHSFKIGAITNETIEFSDFNVQDSIVLPDEAKKTAPEAYNAVISKASKAGGLSTEEIQNPGHLPTNLHH